MMKLTAKKPDGEAVDLLVYFVMESSGKMPACQSAPVKKALKQAWKAGDFSGRAGLDYQVSYSRARVGDFDVDLIHEFFQGFVNACGVTLHIDNLKGDNSHHIAETIFKAFGRALRMGVSPDARMQGILPSTKGHL